MTTKPSTLWIIRVALIIQFAAVLVVPVLVAADDASRGTWKAEWLRPQVAERPIGVLTLKDGKLAFSAQLRENGWEVELSKVKRISQANDGRALLVVTNTDTEYVLALMDPTMLRRSPRQALSIIERAIQQSTANSR